MTAVSSMAASTLTKARRSRARSAMRASLRADLEAPDLYRFPEVVIDDIGFRDMGQAVDVLDFTRGGDQLIPLVINRLATSTSASVKSALERQGDLLVRHIPKRFGDHLALNVDQLLKLGHAAEIRRNGEH